MKPTHGASVAGSPAPDRRRRAMRSSIWCRHALPLRPRGLPALTKLAVVADARNRLDGLLYLGVVRKVGMGLRPDQDVVGQLLTGMTGARGRQLGSGNRLACQFQLELLGLSQGGVERLGDHRAGIDRLFNDQKPLVSRLVLETCCFPCGHGYHHRPGRRPRTRSLAHGSAARRFGVDRNHAGSDR